MERFEDLARSAASASKPSPFDSLADFNDVEPTVAKEPEKKKRSTSMFDLAEPAASASCAPPSPVDPEKHKEPAMPVVTADQEALIRNILRIAEEPRGADPRLASSVWSSNDAGVTASDVATSSIEHTRLPVAEAADRVVPKSPSAVASEAGNERWSSGWYEGSYWRANSQRYGKRAGKKSAFFTARQHALNQGLYMRKWDGENQWRKNE